MSALTSIIIFLGLICVITAAPSASNRRKRQTIFFEDELGGRGSSDQGTGSDEDEDTQQRYGLAWKPPSYIHNHFGHWESYHVEQGPQKFGLGYKPQEDFHGGSSSDAPPKPQQTSDFGGGPVDQVLKREKRQLFGPTNNQRPTVAGNNNGNSDNSIFPPNNNNRPRPGAGGSNNQQIRPPIAIGGARPPSTPPPNCSCPSTSETNPVCGTDGNTYTNPSRLNCARVCGTSVGVQMQHYGACSATTPSPNSRRRG